MSLILHKKLQQLQEKVDATPVANKRPRKRLCAKLNRAKVETSLAIRRVPFRAIKWKEFAREIERAVDEINHLDSETQEVRDPQQPGTAGARARAEARNPQARSRPPAPRCPN